jgi:NAD(P)-dependent dehydrogenase (short-subunit alcohol dehydrogenase family)
MAAGLDTGRVAVATGGARGIGLATRPTCVGRCERPRPGGPSATPSTVRAPNGGAIVNIASMSASIMNRSDPHVAYCASKAGVVHLSRGLGVEWARDGLGAGASFITATDVAVDGGFTAW